MDVGLGRGGVERRRGRGLDRERTNRVEGRSEQNSFNHQKFVAGLALRRFCVRRVGALHGSEIQIEQGVLLVALVLVLLS
jgi:hypothetical protein